MKIKKTLSIAVLAAVLIGSIAIPGKAQTVTIKIDDEKLECPVPARIENGSTMVPMRAIFEALGMSVEWNNEEKSVTATNGEDTIKLTVGKKELVCNGQVKELNVAPYIDSDTTLVPVRAVSESVDATVEWNDEKKQVEITTAEYEANKDKWKENIGTINVTTMTVAGEGVAADGNVIKITAGGDFEVTGENSDAMIHVDTKEKVKLRLSGVSLTNTTGPAIFFENSNKSLITISKGTENFICDGAEYSVSAKAAIFSNDDIEIKGEGSLTVTSKAHHAIASDDDIKIEEGTLILNAEAKDGIHANNEIKIIGGNITVTAKGDGIQAEENIVIEGGEINVTTTGEISNAMGGFGGFGGKGDRWNRSQTTENSQTGNATLPEGMENMTPPEGMGQRPTGGMNQAAQPEGMENMTPPEGMGQRPTGGMNQAAQPEGMENMTPFGQEAEVEDESVATKGIKAETDITITGGKIVVRAQDHAIHSAATITIDGGEMLLSSNGGKGISAHGDVVINSGVITVEKATEGLESKANLTINGGTITITASDDGINAGGTGGRDVASRQNSEQSTGHDLIINGGTIFVNAAGDGLDANGRMIVNGGDIIVEGPTNNGNGALDSGGVIKVNGGTLIALGASGMAENPDSDSKQPSFRLITESNIPSGSIITIKNSAGKEIYSYTTIKTGNSIVFSSGKLIEGETYTVKIGETEYSITLSSTVTSSGGGGSFGGFGGGKGGRGGW